MTVTWYVARDSDGTVSHLLRVHEAEDATWGEYYRDGEWIEDPSVLETVMDGTRGDPVSPEDGEAVERALTIPGR